MSGGTHQDLPPDSISPFPRASYAEHNSCTNDISYFHTESLYLCNYYSINKTVTMQLNLERLSTIVEKLLRKSYIIPLITFQYSNLQFRNINLYHYHVLHESVWLGYVFLPRKLNGLEDGTFLGLKHPSNVIRVTCFCSLTLMHRQEQFKVKLTATRPSVLSMTFIYSV